MDELLLVKEVRGEIIPRQIFYGEGFISILDTRITCVLEDDREFYLERVPPDIVLSLKKMDGETINDERERFVDVLLSMPEVIGMLGKYLKRVVIDELNNETGVYSATVEFGDGEVIIKRKMVPSHAIFLARLTNKPIYVRKELVDRQENTQLFLEREIEDLYSEHEFGEEEFDIDLDEEI